MHRLPLMLLCLSIALAACLSNGPSETLDAGAPAQRVLNASPYAVAADQQLSEWVRVTAEAAVATHCATCHGAELTGRPGIPNLVDYDWLWGITLEEVSDVGPVMEIQQTLLYGVRNTDCPAVADQALYGGCPDTRYSEMPAYGATQVLTEAQMWDLTEYVLSLSGAATDPAAAARAQGNWALCVECHGVEGQGYKPYGGPDLTDDVWLYGGDRDTLYDVIANGRLGTCPAWGTQLDAATIKALAVYIWRQSLGA